MTGQPADAASPLKRAGFFNPTLIAALLSLAVWIFLAFVRPAGAGWVHLFLAAGVILLIRRVVAGRDAW